MPSVEYLSVVGIVTNKARQCPGIVIQEVRGHSMFLSPSDTTSHLSRLWRFVLEGYFLDSIFLILQFKHN